MDREQNNSEHIVNLANVKTPADIIYGISNMLDEEESKNKKIELKLGDIELNQSQILSIRSLINSINSTLSSIETKSPATQNAALALGIVVNFLGKAPAQEPAQTYKLSEDGETVVSSQENDNEQAPVPQEYGELSQGEHQLEEIPSTPRGYEKLDDHVEESEVKVEADEEQAEEVEEEQKTESSQEEIVLNIPTTEEIKEELDTIFNAEKKLEQIFEASNEQNNEPVSESEKVEEEQGESDYTKDDLELESFPTKYIKQTIRSGQVINYEGNIVVIGDCHPGSEVTAAGDITVWGVLSGIAHAGSGGNERARIRALKMNAIQLRVGECYARRPDALNTVFVEKTNVYTPEEARVVNGEIVIFKIND